MANYNLYARKRKGYSLSNGRNNKLYNYIAVDNSERDNKQPVTNPVETLQADRKVWEADVLTRLLATGGDLLGNVTTGVVKGVEGIVDFGIGAVGAVGGLFDEGFRDSMQDAVKYDATHEWLGKHVDKLTEDSFTNNNEIGQIVEGVANGVGQMLPSVIVTIATNGAGAPATVVQAASLATMGVSAAGSATEEAYNDDAGYYEGLGYGVASGAVEVATEKLFGGLTKGITGKGILDFGEEVAEQGIKRIIKGAAEEGAEEVISHAVNPLAKTIYKGKDALKEYTDPEYYKEGGKAFLTGAGTGMVYGGTIGHAVNRAQGVDNDISAAIEANENIRKKLITAQDNGNLTAEAERDAASAELKNLQSIEKKLKRATEKRRAEYIKNYDLGSTFDESGSIRPEILSRKSAIAEALQTVEESSEGNAGTTEQLDKRYYSVGLRGSENTIRKDLASMSTDEQQIRMFSGELSENEQKNFTKMKKALTSLNHHRGEDVSFVIVEANNVFNGAVQRNDTIYIAKDALEKDVGSEGSFAGTMLHEYDHINEGTREHVDLNSFLAEDEELYNAAAERVLGGEYGISREEFDAIQQKQSDGIELTAEEKAKMQTFVSELSATMNEYYLDNERVISKLVADGDPLVNRVLDKIEQMKKALSGKGDKLSISEKRRIDKALKLYLKAAEAAGRRDLVKRIMALREEEENDAIEPLADKNGSYDNENSVSNNVRTTNANNMSVSDGEVRYSIKGDASNKNILVIDTDSELARQLETSDKSKYAVIRNYLIDKFYGQEFKMSDGRIAVMDKRDAQELSHKADSLKAAELSNLRQIVEKASYSHEANNVKHKKFSDFYYYEMTVRYRGTDHDLLLNVGKSKYDGINHIYDITKNKRDANQSTTGLSRPVGNAMKSISSNNSITDSVEKVNSETKFSYKAPAESGVYKQIAEWEKLKVYEKSDAEKMLYTILHDVTEISEDESLSISMTSRKDAEKMLWSELNKALTEKEMKVAAEKVADFIISRSVVKSWMNDPFEAEKINNAETVLSHLKPYLHGLNLTHIRGEIKHKYDTKANGVMLMWGTRKTGYGVDQIITELNSELKGYGFPVDVNANEADLFFAVHDAYSKANSDLKQAYENYRDRVLEKGEQDKLRAEISSGILSTYKDSGRESVLANATRIFKAELWKADQRVEYMKQYNVLISKVDAFRSLTMGKFVNANTYHPDIFAGSVEQLKKIVRGGLISVKSTRDAVGKLAQWYRPDNPVVGEGNYDVSISTKLSQVADGGVSNYLGKKVDVKGLLEPYMHRIDMSSFRDQLSDIYGEELRSVLSTWKLKEGFEPVSMKEIADILSKEGVDIYGGDLELFTQAESMYRDTVRPFDVEDLKNLSDIVAYFTKFIKNFNKVWNGKKYIEAEPIAKKHVDIIRKNKTIKITWFNNLITGRYGKTFFRPETLARRMDLYEDGFYTQTLHEFREGLIRANDYEYEMMKAVSDFDSKNKHYFSDLAKRRIEFRGHKIPADIALSLYMTSKRQQAQAGLAASGFKYNDGKDTIDVQGYMPQKTPGGVEIGAERMQKLLWEEFTKEDKELIRISEELFNGQCKQLKHDTDMNTKGYSNTVDGYYYPIKRAFVAKSVDSDFEDLMGRASNKSFNKDTVFGAKGVLCIMPLTEVLSRHVRGVAQYASLATVVRNYDTLYNYDIGGQANDPVSIARESEKIWKEGGDYYKKLLADMQGIGEKQSAFLSVIRGRYATYQLGGNPKTWVTQLSSFFASTSILDYGSVIRGIGIDGSDVDEYCVLAKLRNANNDAILAQANANKAGLLDKRTKIGDASKKVSDALMTPIGVVDRFVVTKLFGACQAEIERKGGAKVGTKENKIEAGKLLQEVIIKTQQNSLATERSAAMRGGELFKSLTMFSADGMNVTGQVIDAIGEVTTLKAKLRMKLGESERSKLESRLKDANKRAAKAVASLVASSAFMAAISYLFNWLYHRIDEEDEPKDIAGDIAANFIGNMMGGLPVFRDVYSYLSDGYEVQNYMYSVLNDTLEAVAVTRDLAGSVMSDSYDPRKAAQAARKVIYAGGQLLGIPTRNLYNVTYSVLGFIPDVKYKWNNMFYEQAYTADLKKAIEAGDERAIATIIGVMTGERVGDIEDDKVREELNRLTLGGHSVLPKAIADSVTVGEETVELTGKQKKQFKEIYSIANQSVTELMALKQYEEAEDKIKAKAVKLIYDIYYQLAMDDVVGGADASKNVLFAEAISVERLAIIVATARSIEADKDKNGITISGSKKKKIEKYIQSLNLTAVQKYMIMGYLGYKNSNGESSVKSYIAKLNLTKEEKAALLKYSGY